MIECIQRWGSYDITKMAYFDVEKFENKNMPKTCAVFLHKSSAVGKLQMCNNFFSFRYELFWQQLLIHIKYNELILKYFHSSLTT